MTNNMTPQTQAEQKARAVKLLHQETRKVIDDIALLIQKADALDWLEKGFGEITAIRRNISGGKYCSFHWENQFSQNKTLLSAINQARKEQE